MDGKYIYITILAIFAVIILFFILSPKTECGADIGFGDFEKSRCTCLGIIVTDNSDALMLDSTKNYLCHGIKIGETRTISRLEKPLQ